MTSTDAVTGAPIGIAGVTKRYADSVALDDVTLDVRGGEFLTLLGASGSGKSTLLNIIAGFLEPTEGAVSVDGRDITKVPPHRRGLGMVFQHYALFPHMSVADNVAFPLRRQKVARRDIPGRVRDALAVVQLEHLAGRRPSELSGGQQQRVALARAIVARPRVLLMDEPLGALDKLLREQLQLEIRRLHQELGITFVFVTHDQDEALAMSDRIALLRDGSIVQVGSPQSLYERPNCRYTAEFVGASNLFRGTADGGVLVDEVTGVRLRVPGTGRGAVCVLVRPERMHVGARDVTVPPDCDVAHGIVEDCIYLGSSRRVEVRLTGGRTVVLRTDVPRGGDEVRHGADVTVWWRVDDAAVLADDPAGTADPEPSGVLAAQH